MKKISLFLISLLLIFSTLGFTNSASANENVIKDSYESDIISLETGEITGKNYFDIERTVTHLENNLVQISITTSVTSKYIDGRSNDEVLKSNILWNQEEKYYVIDKWEKIYYDPNEEVSFELLNSIISPMARGVIPH